MPISIGFKIFKEPDMSKFEGQAYIGKMVQKQLSSTIPAVKNILEQTTRGWDHQVTFDAIQNISSGEVRLKFFATGPNAELYSLISKGSPPHPIYPKRGGLLKFQTGYRAATSPRMLSSQAKQRSGN